MAFKRSSSFDGERINTKHHLSNKNATTNADLSLVRDVIVHFVIKLRFEWYN